jgi:hypothetical protein
VILRGWGLELTGTLGVLGLGEERTAGKRRKIPKIAMGVNPDTAPTMMRKTANPKRPSLIARTIERTTAV